MRSRSFPMIMASIEMINTKETPATAIREKVKVTEIPAVGGRVFGELYPRLGKGVQCVSPPFALYRSWEGDLMDMEVGFPIIGKGIDAGNVKTIKLPRSVLPRRCISVLTTDRRTATTACCSG